MMMHVLAVLCSQRLGTTGLILNGETQQEPRKGFEGVSTWSVEHTSGVEKANLVTLHDSVRDHQEHMKPVLDPDDMLSNQSADDEYHQEGLDITGRMSTHDVISDATFDYRELSTVNAQEYFQPVLGGTFAHMLISSEVPDTVIQYGRPRSATTLQYRTLCSIMKLVKGTSVRCGFVADLNDEPEWGREFRVIKTHQPPQEWPQHMFKDNVWFFFTGDNGINWHSEAAHLANDLGRDVKYVQLFDNLAMHGYTLAADYQPIFALNNSQCESLLTYLRYWDVLRQCCGPQMSQDWRATLQHDAAHEPYWALEDTAYPACEMYDIDKVQSNMLNTKLGHWGVESREVKAEEKCSFVNRQIACQNLAFNEQPKEPYC
jgi:hypothetical protein